MAAAMTIQMLKLLAGTGMFLFAMHLIEEALKNVSGRSFKLFLRRVTKNNLGAVAGGALVTGVLQSSSMVSMMVLAFTGAGVFTLRNAMAVILGANLGTTLASWVVATLGFKMNIDVIAYPAIGAGGLMLLLFAGRKMVIYAAYFLLGFGLLFISLAFMKEAMAGQTFDLSRYARLPSIAFLLVGFIITLLVQSSSVTMALTLSALHAGTISLPVAAAIVLGSETGTSIKLLLAGMGGNVVKKRVALGNFLFNIVLTMLVFALLRQVLWLIKDVIKIKDPLIGLVSFSSLVNLLTIAVFLPILGPFTRLLERFYRHANHTRTPFLEKINPARPAEALGLLLQETGFFIYTSLQFNRRLFEIEDGFKTQPDYERLLAQMHFFSKSHSDMYEHLKQVQGEIQACHLKLLAGANKEQEAQLQQLNAAARNSIYAAKSMKDVRTDTSNLRRSSKDVKYALFVEHRRAMSGLYGELSLLLPAPGDGFASSLKTLLAEVEHRYGQALETFYKGVNAQLLEDTDITTAINFNREVYASHKAMLLAIGDYLACAAAWNAHSGKAPGRRETGQVTGAETAALSPGGRWGG